MYIHRLSCNPSSSQEGGGGGGGGGAVDSFKSRRSPIFSPRVSFLRLYNRLPDFHDSLLKYFYDTKISLADTYREGDRIPLCVRGFSCSNNRPTNDAVKRATFLFVIDRTDDKGGQRGRE